MTGATQHSVWLNTVLLECKELLCAALVWPLLCCFGGWLDASPTLGCSWCMLNCCCETGSAVPNHSSSFALGLQQCAAQQQQVCCRHWHACDSYVQLLPGLFLFGGQRLRKGCRFAVQWCGSIYNKWICQYCMLHGQHGMLLLSGWHFSNSIINTCF
jgi:hypothetical protein